MEPTGPQFCIGAGKDAYTGALGYPEKKGLVEQIYLATSPSSSESHQLQLTEKLPRYVGSPRSGCATTSTCAEYR